MSQHRHVAPAGSVLRREKGPAQRRTHTEQRKEIGGDPAGEQAFGLVAHANRDLERLERRHRLEHPVLLAPIPVASGRHPVAILDVGLPLVRLPDHGQLIRVRMG